MAEKCYTLASGIRIEYSALLQKPNHGNDQEHVTKRLLQAIATATVLLAHCGFCFHVMEAPASSLIDTIIDQSRGFRSDNPTTGRV